MGVFYSRCKPFRKKGQSVFLDSNHPRFAIFVFTFLQTRRPKGGRYTVAELMPLLSVQLRDTIIRAPDSEMP
jgi:hypothetical protein